MKVNRGNLVQTLELVSAGLSTRNIVEQSNCYCFRNGKVFSYDDETAAIHKSPLDVEGAVPAEPLKDILFKMKDEEIEVTQVEDHLMIKGKREKVQINMDKKIELPIENLENPSTWKSLPGNFAEAVKLVETCAGKDDSQFSLTCIHVHPHWIEAYDTMQFARFSLETGLPEPVLVKQGSLRHIIDLDMHEFSLTKEWIHFRNASGLTIACRRYTDQYPTLGKLCELKGKKIQLPKSLSELSQRAEVFSSYNIEDNQIRIDITPGTVSVQGESQYGKYKGRRKLDYTGERLSFMVHPQMLNQLISQHTLCEVCIDSLAIKATKDKFIFVACLSRPEVKPKKIKEQKSQEN